MNAAEARAGVARLLKDGALRALIVNTGMVGVAGALMNTSGSLFLADEVGATPLMIGLFFAGRGVLEIASGLVVGALSDRMRSRRVLLGFCSFLCAAGALTYMLLRNYYLLFGVGAVLFGLGGACFSQLFAYNREFAQARGLNATSFNSALSSITSLAWVFGPPIGFFIIASSGFTTLYLVAAMLYVTGGVLCLRFLPDLSSPARERRPVASPFTGTGPSTWLLVLAVMIMLAVNNAYQINVALFVTRDLGIDEGFVGLLLGAAAALEVPVMMLLSAYADRIGKERLLLAAVACATLFFCALPFVESRTGLMLLQVPNAVWTAIVLTLPVTMLQDSMPDRVGAASSLFTSAFHAGILIGGTTTGVVADLAGFTNVFWVCAALTAVTALLLLVRENTVGSRPAAPRDRRPTADSIS
jgi:SET family sugar efflux transporter-like MFS transporter